MVRRLMSLGLIVTMALGVTLAAADGHAGPAPTGAVLSAADQAAGNAEALTGASKCFGWGSENCCSEFVLAGGVAGIVGALPAALLALGAWYYYCG